MVAVVLLAAVIASPRTHAEDARDTATLLNEAERLRITDKPKSRELLTGAEKLLSPTSNPLLIAQARYLDCRLADDVTTARRAVAAGLKAEAGRSAGLRAKLLSCDAIALQTEGKPREAEAEYLAAATLAATSKELKVQAEALSFAAWLQYNRGAMADAAANLQFAYKLSERIGDDAGRLEALSQMANIDADAHVGQYDRALASYRQLLAEYQRLGKQSDVGDTLYNIGSTLEAQGNFAAAELQYRRALATFEKVQSESDVAYTQRALGSSLMKQGRAKESLPFFDAALAFYIPKRDDASIAFVRQFRGGAYRRLGRSDEALRDLDSARAYWEAEKNVRYVERNVDETALVYEQLGDWRNAYAFRKRHEALLQELAVERREEVASRLRVEFDAAKKEQENKSLSRENELRAAALREAQHNQNLQLAVIALTALLALALAILFWRQFAHARRMRSMAMTDELTRLPNRRHILAAAEIAIASARRNGHAAALIVFDIDKFKLVNDNYGHAAGDEILRRVARTCRMSLRPNDQIGRIGGEEFLVVLHDATTARQAYDVAERLRVAVEQLDVSSIAPDLRITISLGVSVTDEHDVTAAVSGADALLYQAKESGRNRVGFDPVSAGDTAHV